MNNHTVSFNTFQYGRLPVKLNDEFPEIRKGGRYLPGVVLVACLHAAWHCGRTIGIQYHTGVSDNTLWNRLKELEKRLGYKVYIRRKNSRKPFSLTKEGENLIRRYLGYPVK